jgi:hypothetical protein
MRRFDGRMNGEKFLADKNSMVVHDLDNEKNQCGIDEIISEGFEKPYTNITYAQWDGFSICLHCIKQMPQKT